MSYFCIHVHVHQPRHLKSDASIADPFDDLFDQHLLEHMAEHCYLPTNRLFAHLIKATPEFRLCISVSGVLLQLARRFHPRLVQSYEDLASLGRKTGRIEFLAMPFHNSLSSLFEHSKKLEFREQIGLHMQEMNDLLGVTPTAFHNSELLFNNSIATVAGELGFKAILCEPRNDMLRGNSPNSVYVDRKQHIRILPRNYGLSDDLSCRFKQRVFTAKDFADWAANVDGEMALVGINCRFLENVQDHRELTVFWNQLPAALNQHACIVPRNPSEIAEKVGGKRPIAEVEDLSTSSWSPVGRDTSTWLGSPSQHQLFGLYQKLETTVKSSGDTNLLELWRHLGAASNYVNMQTSPRTIDYANQKNLHNFQDSSEATMAYTAILTKLQNELSSGRRHHRGQRRKDRRPRILLVTPEVTELPPGLGNLANFVNAKGGGAGRHQLGPGG